MVRRLVPRMLAPQLALQLLGALRKQGLRGALVLGEVGEEGLISGNGTSNR